MAIQNTSVGCTEWLQHSTVDRNQLSFNAPTPILDQ
jgi:hypothetical protein